MKVNIALTQMRCEKGIIDVNIKSMAEYINECKLKNTDIIIFPEMDITGYINPDKYPYAVISREHSAINRVAQMSKEFGVVFIAGIVEKNPEGKPFITQFAAQNGEINGFYRKKTVKDQEAEWFSPGDDILVLPYNKINYGISICADIDDEDIFKELSQSGANIIFECAAPGLYGEQETRNWQSGYDWWKGECHNKLVKYAYENKIYIAA